MIPSTDFDRLLTSWLEAAGPADPGRETIDAALGAARGCRQRRGLLAWLVGPGSWPAYGARRGFTALPSTLRIALLVGLVLALLGGTLYVGGQVLRPLREAVMVPDASASPAATATSEALPPGAWGAMKPDNLSFGMPSGPGQIMTLEFGSTARVRLSPYSSRPVFESSTTVVADHQVRLVITSLAGVAERGTPVWIDQRRLAGCKLGDVGLYTWSTSADGALLTLASDGDACPSREAVLARTWSLPTPRAARACSTATLLPDGRVLVAGGEIDGSAVASADLYDAKTGTVSPTGSMTAARDCSTATLLPDGRVLVAGGVLGPMGYVDPAEIYDPTTGTFSPTGSMTAARLHPTATLLPDGRVLVAGGWSIDDGTVAPAEIYDPTTGTFSTTGSLAPPRSDHTATLLPDGRVLVAGGEGDSGPVATADLYDPTTGTFSPTGSMRAARASHTATLLPDGRVLVVGGWSDSGAVVTADLYDPMTGTFSTTGSLAPPRTDHTATLLPDGRVLVAGGSDLYGNGYDPAVLATADLYDPTTGTFSPTGSMTAARRSHTATLLPDGRVLVAGGGDEYGLVAPAEIYDPKTGTFSPTGP